MRRSRRLALFAALGLVMVAGALFWWVGASEFIAKDSCLDSGGRWGDGGSCEFEQPAR
jgi:hypothetical protein